ncbi:MAG: V-type ATP synthase subunit E family protein [Planctomycetota bacterium]
MESVERGKALLISGIEADAGNEEKEIIAEAEKRAEEKRKYAEKKIESLLNDARKDAQEQAETVKKKIISGVEFEIKRRSLRLRSVLMRDLTDRVEKKLALMIGDSKYKSVLVDWITEAAVGLDAESAQINASEKERKLVDAELLAEVAKRIYEHAGRQVALGLSDAEPLKSQGVVLTAADGRTAFNNQVTTRMLRSQREIRTLIYNALFADDRKE